MENYTNHKKTTDDIKNDLYAEFTEKNRELMNKNRNKFDTLYKIFEEDELPKRISDLEKKSSGY